MNGLEGVIWREWVEAMTPLTEAQRQYARQLVIAGSDQAVTPADCRSLLLSSAAAAAELTPDLAAHTAAAMQRVTS
jgi:hypothetical protein